MGRTFQATSEPVPYQPRRGATPETAHQTTHQQATVSTSSTIPPMTEFQGTDAGTMILARQCRRTTDPQDAGTGLTISK